MHTYNNGINSESWDKLNRRLDFFNYFSDNLFNLFFLHHSRKKESHFKDVVLSFFQLYCVRIGNRQEV